MLIMEQIIAESDDMYKAGQKKEHKKDVRQSKGHINNKPHGLIAASKHPKVGHVQVGNVEEQAESQGKD